MAEEAEERRPDPRRGPREVARGCRRFPDSERLGRRAAGAAARARSSPGPERPPPGGGPRGGARGCGRSRNSAAADYDLPMAATPRVLVPLADGFEEIEAVAVVDVLRRAGFDVVLAGLGAGPGAVEGSHGIRVLPDAPLDDVDIDAVDMLVLPGGPGHQQLAKDARVLSAVRALHERGRHTAAICAAPVVLARAGVLSGVAVTSHPTVRDQLGDADVRAAPRVVRSGKVITSQGAGTAVEFALALVAELAGSAKADELARAIVADAG